MRPGSRAWWSAFVALLGLLGAVMFAASPLAMAVCLALAGVAGVSAAQALRSSRSGGTDLDDDDTDLDVGEPAEVHADADEAICLFCGRGYPAVFAYCPDCRRTPSVYDT